MPKLLLKDANLSLIQEDEQILDPRTKTISLRPPVEPPKPQVQEQQDEPITAKIKSFFSQGKTPQQIKEAMSLMVDTATDPEQWKALGQIVQTGREQVGNLPGIKQAREFLTPESDEAARRSGLIKIGDSYVDPMGISSLERAGSKAVAKGAQTLTTRFLEYLKGKKTVSRQEVLDFANRPELKKGEADLLLKKLEQFDSDALTQEARKYKSAEEFVKAQGETVFRGGQPYKKELLNSTELRGLPVTRNREVAESFADSISPSDKYQGGLINKGKTGTVEDIVITKDAKILPVNDAPKDLQNIFRKESRHGGVEEISKWAEKNGYDAVDFGDFELRVLNPDKIKTKSQLTDIWEKANKGDKLLAKDFADSIRRDLLELKPVRVEEPQYKSITIRERQRGEVARGKIEADVASGNYEEVVFESPITTNGSSHFQNSKNYFAHARGDEVVESGKKIWREQEIQSDLLQKDVLEGKKHIVERTGFYSGEGRLVNRGGATVLEPPANVGAEWRLKEMEKLDPFTNDRFGERIMRERIREKAAKGYEKYRLPTGETIGKIEGFRSDTWVARQREGIVDVTPENLTVGAEIIQHGGDAGDMATLMQQPKWIITDILGDGRFKAVPKAQFNKGSLEELDDYINGYADLPPGNAHRIESLKETFDLTGKSNPQYRRYEQWGKFLKNKYGAKQVTDPQGNSWYEIDLKPEYATDSVMAFGHSSVATTILTGLGIAATTLVGEMVYDIVSEANKVDNQDVLKLIETSDDIAELKAIEQALNASGDEQKKAELGQAVADKIAELQNERAIPGLPEGDIITPPQ